MLATERCKWKTTIVKNITKKKSDIESEGEEINKYKTAVTINEQSAIRHVISAC